MASEIDEGCKARHLNDGAVVAIQKITSKVGDMKRDSIKILFISFLFIGTSSSLGCAPTTSNSSSSGTPVASETPSTDQSDVTPLFGDINHPKIAAGDFHTCRIFMDGSLKCWGFNLTGQLGQGHTFDLGAASGEMASLPAVKLGTDRKALAVVAGDRYTCALLDNKAVKCFGEGAYGVLGYEDRVNRGVNSGEMGDWLPEVDLGEGRTVESIAGGAHHMCALLDHGDVKCWGYNNSGQLGLGDTTIRGDRFGQMGDQLPAVFLGVGRSAIAISAGGSTSCALLDDHTTKCWGSNSAGELGQASTTPIGRNPGELASLTPIQLGHFRFPKQISSGAGSTCALLDNDTVKCWGSNWAGQLGKDDTMNRGDNTGEMGDALLSIFLGSQETASLIRTSGSYSCAVLKSPGLKCWGYNGYGQLGLGDLSNRGDNAGEMTALKTVNLGTGKFVLELATGPYHACAILNDNSTKCWGRNEKGELGLGDKMNRGDQPGEMGDALPAINFGT